MPREAKEQQILAAAESLFTSRRFHEVTMDDVSHTAKVGKGTIYRYFKDKDDLFFRLALSGWEELCELADVRLRGEEPVEEQLRGILAELRQLLTRRQPIFRLIHSEEMRQSGMHDAVHGRCVQARQRFLAALAELFRRGAAAGQIRSDIPPATIASALMNMFRGFAGHGEADCPDALFMEVFLRGVSTPDYSRNENP